MSTEAPELSDLFPLRHMRGILRNVAPPDGDFDPQGTWHNRYRVYSITGGDAPVGRLELTRTPLPADRFRLEVAYSHPLQPDVYTRCFSAVMECHTDAYATPISWSVTNWSEDRRGSDVPNLRWTREGTFEGGTVMLSDKLGHRRQTASGAVANHWGLFEAIQRLPRTSQAHELALLDDFNRLKPGAQLCYRNAERVAMGGRIARRLREITLEKGVIQREEFYREDPQILTLQTFDMTGWGIVPWVYFVDPNGRLLVAVSGIEGYVLDTGAQET